MELTHRHVEVFKAIMEAPSVTAASVMMGTSQPTLSRELSELEDLLGFELFLRVGRRLKPTAAAFTLFGEIQRSYIGLNHIRATAAEIGKFGKGQLSVLCFPGLAHVLLSAVCRRFRQDHQGISISLVPQESPLLEEWLTAQLHDLGLTEHDHPLPGTSQETLFVANEICVIPKGHRLLAKDVLHPVDFAGESFVSLAPTDHIRIRLDEIFRQHGVTREMSLEAHDAVTVCSLVRQGLGITIVNPLTALDFEGRDVELRRFAVSVPFRISMIRPIHRPFTPLVDQFIAAVKVEIALIFARLPRGEND